MSAAPAKGTKKKGRSLNLDDEAKGSESNAYQYGVVGGTATSPSTTPLQNGQYPSLAGAYGHQRNTSREALMATGGPSSPTHAPNRLDASVSSSQRRISQISSARGDSIMMANQPVTNRSADENVPWGHHPRPSSSLLAEAPTGYPPAPVGAGFYQQYGPYDAGQQHAAVPPAPAMTSPTRPPLEVLPQPAAHPVPAHHALSSVAGLPERSPSRAPTLNAPPPGAAGARPYSDYGNTTPPVASGSMDRSAVSRSPSASMAGNGVDVGFGRQQRDEKTPRVETPQSPVIQHQDAGSVPDSNTPEAPPPAYSQT